MIALEDFEGSIPKATLGIPADILRIRKLIDGRVSLSYSRKVRRKIAAEYGEKSARLFPPALYCKAVFKSARQSPGYRFLKKKGRFNDREFFAFCERAGMQEWEIQMFGALLTGATPPGRNKNMCKKIAAFLNCSVEDLFPSEAYASQDLESYRIPFSYESRYIDDHKEAKQKQRETHSAVSSTYDIQKEVVSALLRRVKLEEAEIIDLHFGLSNGRERTLEELGTELGCTRSNVGQIVRKILLRFREILDASDMTKEERMAFFRDDRCIVI
jgi:hypothetical protein